MLTRCIGRPAPPALLAALLEIADSLIQPEVLGRPLVTMAIVKAKKAAPKLFNALHDYLLFQLEQFRPVKKLLLCEKPIDYFHQAHMKRFEPQASTPTKIAQYLFDRYGHKERVDTIQKQIKALALKRFAVFDAFLRSQIRSICFKALPQLHHFDSFPVSFVIEVPLVRDAAECRETRAVEQSLLHYLVERDERASLIAAIGLPGQLNKDLLPGYAIAYDWGAGGLLLFDVKEAKGSEDPSYSESIHALTKIL